MGSHSPPTPKIGMDNSLPLTHTSLLSAHALIKPHIHRTPLLTNTTLNSMSSVPQSYPPHPSSSSPPSSLSPLSSPNLSLFLKSEPLQRTGSFKIRGAFHALSRLLSLPPESPTYRALKKNGVITHSSGNHAQALALAAREMGVKATIVMPKISVPGKIEATRGYGARVVFSGSTAAEREAVVEMLMEEAERGGEGEGEGKGGGIREEGGDKGGEGLGMVLVPPYDANDIVLGQGTMGLEMQGQLLELVGSNPGLSRHRDRGGRFDAVIAPVGGGGMLAGVATAFAGTGTRVFGAEPSFEGADDCRRGLEQGRRVESVSSLTVADGVRTPVGEIPWSVISDPEKVKGVFAVSEEEILRAMRVVWERMKIVVEPTAALGVAVVLFCEEFRRLVEREGGEEGWDVGVVLSGGNVDLDAVGDLLARGKGKKGGEVSDKEVERAEGKIGLDGERRAENVAG